MKTYSRSRIGLLLALATLAAACADGGITGPASPTVAREISPALIAPGTIAIDDDAMSALVVPRPASGYLVASGYKDTKDSSDGTTTKR